MNRYSLGMAAAAVVWALAVPAAAQSVTANDIQRLQDQVYDASGDVSRLRDGGDARLQSDLDDVRDEVVYLKVKLRKEGNVSRSEFNDLRNRVQSIRSQARGDARGNDPNNTRDNTRGNDPYNPGNNSGNNSGNNAGNTGGWRTNSDPATTSNTGTRAGGVSGGVVTDDRTRPDQSSGTRNTQGTNNGAIPSGQEIDVQLKGELSSATAQVEQRFEATTVADLYRGNEVLIPAGSVVRGVVSSVTKTTRMERKGSLTVAFDQITVRGRNYPIRGTVTQALESEGIKGEATKIGAGAGIGAIIGGIIGGVKGALLGVLIGGGGTIAATEGKDVTLPTATILRVRLDTPPAIR